VLTLNLLSHQKLKKILADTQDTEDTRSTKDTQGTNDTQSTFLFCVSNLTIGYFVAGVVIAVALVLNQSSYPLKRRETAIGIFPTIFFLEVLPH
jgi:hypothetical protein